VVVIKDSVTNKSVGDLTVSGYSWGNTSPQSQYDPNNLVEMPTRLQGFTLTSDKEVATDGTSPVAGRNAVIQAGGNVSITATKTLQNSVIHEDYGSTGGSNKVGSTNVGNTGTTVIRINSQLPPDLAQQQVNPLSLPGFSLPTGENGLFRLSGQGASDSAPVGATGPAPTWTVGGQTVDTQEHIVAGTIGGPRNLFIDAPPAVSDSTRAVDTFHRTPSMVQAVASTVDVNVPVNPAGPGMKDRGNDAKESIDTRPVTRVTGLPDTKTPSNAHKYLIETNPVLTDLKSFMSSDYLLEKLGYDPDQSAKRLGDGLYEQRLIQQAVTARTGQAFIDGQTSNEGMFKYLMNNAIASKDALNLSVGVGLTSQQVAALTHDIVWLEEHEVNGEKVLVPVVYLAQANGRLGPTGALIAGNDVTLIAGENLDNVGTLKATNNLSATAGKDLVNSGLIQAGNRLDLLAANDVVNKSGGIITGRDVSVKAIVGDVVNERTMTSSDSISRFGTQHHDYADSAARIEATNNLTVKAGQDISIVGGVLQSGRDMDLNAGRDLTVSSVQLNNSIFHDKNHNSSDTTQLGASLSAGRDLSAQAGRDISVIASQIDARRDIDMAAAENLIIASAADESHSYSKSKKVTSQEDHIKQVASTVTAGGNVIFSAAKDMALVSSRITAGEEAYLVAGGQLDVMAAQDTDYSLYDKKKKGSFGSSQTRRDEVTKITNVGTQITVGGDLTLKSGGDQRYQVARLESGGDILLQSDGSITFEALKDLNQESHEKSSSSLAWTSMQGKGHTDETLRQTQLIARGDIAIKAVEGLHIDVKQINGKTVSQSIDAMVQADPNLAWLKEAEKRGDVDWRQIKETHESFKYSNSGLGQGAMLAIVIIVTVLTAGAGGGPAAAIGASASSAASSAAIAAGASASMAASIGTAAAAAASAAYTAVVTQSVISTINNKGDLIAALKDVTSPENLKGYLTTGLAAGFAAGVLDNAFSVSPDGANSATHGFKLGDLEGFTKFAGYTLSEKGFTAITSTALNGGSFKDSLAQAALSSVADVLSASVYSKLGDQLEFTGIPARVGAHAIVGGLLAEAAGGSFRTGALAAGANEAFVSAVGSSIFAGPMHKQLLTMTSQLLGLVVAAGAGGTEKDQQVASWLAGQATTYNFLGHEQQEALAKKLDETCHGNVACIKDELRKIKPLADSQNDFTEQEQKNYDDAHESLLNKLLGNCQSDSCRTLTALKMEMAALNCGDISCMREEAGAIQKGQYISQNQWGQLGLDFLDDAGRVLAAIIPGLGAGAGTVKATAAELPPLRQAYVEQVGMLEEIALSMRAAGATPEQVARQVSGMRRELGVKFKNITPPEKLEEIYARNLKQYGDKLGPTIEWLRAKGKSWEQITESASRAGGKDLGF
jgi:filamentous hemagglutinin